eukprot:9736962-Ditylum_brightwellii.AAC.1
MFDQGNDIAEALRNFKEPIQSLWEPRLEVSTSVNQATEEIEKRENKIKYKMKVDAYLKRSRTFNNNKFKAYALLWERCGKSMQNKITARTDHESDVYNKPICLAEVIKEHSHNYEETRYEMAIMADAFRAVFTTRQKDKENLQDYTQQFKTLSDILLSHIGGPIILLKYYPKISGYDSNDKEEYIKKGSNHLL